MNGVFAGLAAVGAVAAATLAGVPLGWALFCGPVAAGITAVLCVRIDAREERGW